MAQVSISIELDDLPMPAVDEDRIQTWIGARLNDATNLFKQRVQRGQGTGKYHRRGGKRRSAPGEYPVTEAGTADAGTLANWVSWEIVGPREGVLYNDAPYARYLVEGTIYMEPRKMMRDALEEVLLDRPDPDGLGMSATIK